MSPSWAGAGFQSRGSYTLCCRYIWMWLLADISKWVQLAKGGYTLTGDCEEPLIKTESPRVTGLCSVTTRRQGVEFSSRVWSQLASFCWANLRHKSRVRMANSQNNRLVAGALCFLMVVQTRWFSSPAYRSHILLLWADPCCKQVNTKWSPEKVWRLIFNSWHTTNIHEKLNNTVSSYGREVCCHCLSTLKK